MVAYFNIFRGICHEVIVIILTAFPVLDSSKDCIPLGITGLLGVLQRLALKRTQLLKNWVFLSSGERMRSN